MTGLGLFVLTVFGLTCSYALTWLMRSFARRFDLLDHPDGKRKLQKRTVPLGGGIAVFTALSCTTLLSACGFFGAVAHQHCLPILLSVGSICLLGLWDDKYNMRASRKLFFQIVCCLPVAIAGRSISDVSVLGLQLDLGWLSIPMTVFWLVACANAINLIDGLDGLASSLGIVAIAALAVLAILAGNLPLAALSLSAVGCITGFLLHNWPPARIYLGDAGSYTIGLLVGALSIEASQKSVTGYLMIVPLALLAVPLFDTAMAILRRTLSGKAITEPDRHHVHHCIRDRGFTSRSTLLLRAGLSLFMAGCALAAFQFQNEFIALAAGTVVFTGLVCGRLFGHREALMLMRRFRLLTGGRVEKESLRTLSMHGHSETSSVADANTSLLPSATSESAHQTSDGESDSMRDVA